MSLARRVRRQTLSTPPFRHSATIRNLTEWRTRSPGRARHEVAVELPTNPCGVHLPTSETLQLFADEAVVRSDELAPPPVTEFDRPLSRTDDVGEQDGRKEPIGSSGPSAPRQRIHRLTASAARPGATPTPESSPTAYATSTSALASKRRNVVRQRHGTRILCRLSARSRHRQGGFWHSFACCSTYGAPRRFSTRCFVPSARPGSAMAGLTSVELA